MAETDTEDRTPPWGMPRRLTLVKLRLTFALLALLGLCACDKTGGAANPLDNARQLAAQGRYEEALKQHVWIHDHVLETDPSYYGVRLSFALADWVKLGEEYPQALERLKGIRDEKTARLLAGETNRNLFHDVEAINDHLGESAATADLFEELAAKEPEFAALVYELVEESLIAAREYEIARKYLGDPMKRFARAEQRFEQGIQFSESSPSRDATRTAYERIFAGEVVRIITVLDRTDDPELAREVQSRALATLDSPAIRNAMDP